MSENKQIQIVQMDNTTIVMPNFQDGQPIDSDNNSSDSVGSTLALFNDLNKFALRVRNIISSPQKYYEKKVRLVMQALKGINFKEMGDGTAYSYHEVAEEEKEETPEDSPEDKIIEVLTHERDQYKRQAQQLRTQIEQTGQGNIIMLNSLDEQLIKLQARKSDFDEKQKILNTYEKEIQSLKDQFRKQSESLTQTNLELHRKIALLEEEGEALKREVGKNQMYIIEQGKNKKLEEEINSRNQTIKMQEKALGDLNEQIKRLNANIHDLEAERSELHIKNTKLAKEYENQHKEIREISSQQNKILLRKLADKQSTIGRLEQLLQSKNSEIQAANERIAVMRSQLDKLNQQLIKSNNDKRMAEQSMQIRLSLANQDLQTNTIKFQQRIHQLTSQAAAYQQQLRELRDFRVNNQGQVTLMGQQILALQNQVTPMRRQILTLQDQLTQPLTEPMLYQQITVFFHSLTPALKIQFKKQISIHIGGLR